LSRAFNRSGRIDVISSTIERKEGPLPQESASERRRRSCALAGSNCDEILTKSGDKKTASFAAERQMGLWRRPTARPLGCGAVPKETPSIRLLILGAAGILVCVMLLAGLLLWDARRTALEHAAQSRDNVAAAIEHDVERTIELYDLSLQAAIEGLRLPGINDVSPEIRNQILFDGAVTARYLGSTMVLDDTGKVTIDSRQVTPPDRNFADRDFFRAHRDQQRGGLYLSAPFTDGPAGNWSIALSRRLEHPDGSFAGVVFGTLRLDFFGHLFALIDNGSGGVISLLRSDGKMIYRTPFDEKLIGADFGNWGLFHKRAQSKTGTVSVTSPIDGIERYYTYRRVSSLPLVLAVGMAQDTVLSNWRQKAISIGMGMLALAAAVAGLVSALGSELSRRSRAERTALETGRQYRFLAEHSFDMIVRFDPRTQQRTYVSPAVRRLYGYEPEEAMAIPADHIIHPDDLPGVGAALARLEHDSEQPPILYRGRRKDGSYIWVEASLTRSRDPDSGATEIVSIVRDVSERVRYEAALYQAKEEADGANRAKSQFLATMSHELRTPLNAIIGFAEVMQQEVMGPVGNAQYRSYITDIHVSGTHLLQLINDILDLTKAEAGKLELNEETVDLGEVIQSVMRVSRGSIEKAGLTANIDLTPGLPRLRADERKTRQVLFNLVGNAVKFTPAGGRIDIRAHFDQQAGMRITVADTGIGIAPENLQRVFEPFVQIDNSLSRQQPGTGLGLPAVKAIMELHGGSLELRSVVGVGTEATAAFPPERTVAADPSAPARSAA
jgi:PAS domain S-box-containing protein